MQQELTKRIVARKLARELTPEEIGEIGGGGGFPWSGWASPDDNTHQDPAHE